MLGDWQHSDGARTLGARVRTRRMGDVRTHSHRCMLAGGGRLPWRLLDTVPAFRVLLPRSCGSTDPEFSGISGYGLRGSAQMLWRILTIVSGAASPSCIRCALQRWVVMQRS